MLKTDKVTDVESIRNISKVLLVAVDITCDNQFGIISHPFTNHIFSVGENHELINLTNDDDRGKWIEMMKKRIDNSGVDRIYMMLNKPWRISWLKYAEHYLSDRDFASYLVDAYISEEMPNLNPDVSTKELIKWFKKADKRVLMEDEDYQKWLELPDKVLLYRGVSHCGNSYGLSWTDHKDAAEWFANRFANEEYPGRVYKVLAPKECCLCYFGSRGEHEIILDVDAVKNKIIQIT